MCLCVRLWLGVSIIQVQVVGYYPEQLEDFTRFPRLFCILYSTITYSCRHIPDANARDPLFKSVFYLRLPLYGC